MGKWRNGSRNSLLNCRPKGRGGSSPLLPANLYFVSLMAERHFYMVTAVVRFHHEVPSMLPPIHSVEMCGLIYLSLG